ncbi:hypothetical protein DF185_08110 [Marinifilum breve]|uniref:Putative auto-transporter adhesin head GIN domain-containing protein n=1 Tax=Marinifilum breve TaxID=2184082 RepID=A0A2V3ZYA0_9BACT|nr:DUF2807 domain-containing protein [Marinifilum breve]PXY01439.1 hypothetical protein DF185_08110 [Marinifilum breve]
MKIIHYLLILFYLLNSSCSFINPLEDSGTETDVLFETKTFNTIVLEGIFSITIIQDDSHSIYFKGGENILDKFSFTDQENTLTIKHDYSNWLHNLEIPKLEIHCSELKEIKFQTSCNLQTEGTLSGDKMAIFLTEEADIVEMNLNLKFDTFSFDSRGSSSGKHTFKGICNNANFTLNSSNNIFANELETDKMRIGHNGLGNAHIWVNDSLNVTFYNSGNVYYKGNPYITVNRVQVNNQKASGQVLPQ